MQSLSEDSPPSNQSLVEDNVTIVCADGFEKSSQSGFCVPVCGEWKEFSDDTILAFDVVTTFFYIVHVCGTVIAVALSIYQYKHM